MTKSQVGVVVDFDLLMVRRDMAVIVYGCVEMSWSENSARPQLAWTPRSWIAVNLAEVWH